jgi:hypothetical protein
VYVSQPGQPNAAVIPASPAVKVDLVRSGGVRQHAVEAVRSYVADEGNAQWLHAMADEFYVGILREIVTLPS